MLAIPQASIMNILNYTRIGNIIPKHSLTLVTGLPATGKSFTILKFLNQEQIKPFVFNLDEDPALLQFPYLGMTSDRNLLKGFLNGEVEDLDNEVIVIDTYSRMIAELGLENTKEEQRQITDTLLNLCRDKGYTILIIGHPEDYIGRSSVFKDNQSLVRDCHEHLHFDKILSTGRTLDKPLYRFSINKGRGIGGTQIIDNWMRP